MTDAVITLNGLTKNFAGMENRPSPRSTVPFMPAT